MSGHEVIRDVSASLRALLRDRVARPPGVTDVPVTVGTPRPVPAGASPAAEPARLNLFLYRVSESPYLKNLDAPPAGSPTRYGSPPLSLHLHYLLTAFGSVLDSAGDTHDESRAQLVLGSAMRVLHETPILTEDLVSTRDPVDQPLLAAGLADSVEQITVTLDPVGLDDLTKVWTALTTPFRLSAAYLVTVVQIDQRARPPVAVEVGEGPAAGPRVRVHTLRTPAISRLRVLPAGAADQPRAHPVARIGDTLVVEGTSLLAPAPGRTLVRVGGIDLPLAAAPVPTPDRVAVVIPDAALPDGRPIPPESRLQPGTHTVSVATSGTVAGPARSAPAAMMIVPAVAAVVVEAEPGGTGRILKVTGSRLHVPGQPGETLIGRVVVPAASYLEASPTSLRVRVPAALLAEAGPPTPVPVRVRAAGVSSIDRTTVELP
ncbi:DUF4255 domain-containing protein [Frankia sp. CiP1_Cm_nod2]|uniref:DUF4255 domain-containing protein n=1 Tax=Frankia sp. CiP1_Cm_nod2 TaxID=2897161 RepID=UPI00202575BC